MINKLEKMICGKLKLDKDDLQCIIAVSGVSIFSIAIMYLALALI